MAIPVVAVAASLFVLVVPACVAVAASASASAFASLSALVVPACVGVLVVVVCFDGGVEVCVGHLLAVGAFGVVVHETVTAAGVESLCFRAVRVDTSTADTSRSVFR